MVRSNGMIGNSRFVFEHGNWTLKDTVSGNFSNVYMISTNSSNNATLLTKLNAFNMTIEWTRIQTPVVQSITVGPKEQKLVASKSVTGSGGSYSFYIYDISRDTPSYSHTIAMTNVHALTNPVNMKTIDDAYVYLHLDIASEASKICKLYTTESERSSSHCYEVGTASTPLNIQQIGIHQYRKGLLAIYKDSNTTLLELDLDNLEFRTRFGFGCAYYNDPSATW